MAARRINSARFTIEPQIDENTRAGTEVTVSVTVPANANSSGPQWYFKDSVLTTRVVIVRN